MNAGKTVDARVFLGWDGPFLERAAQWLSERAREEGSAGGTGEWVVVLPGGRAVRRLEDRLAQRLEPSDEPPRVVTEGGLARALAPHPLRLATPTARIAAWVGALQKTPARALRKVFSEPPGEDELRPWLALARELSALSSQLAAEGLDAAAVAADTEAPFGKRERERWQVLAGIEQRARAALSKEGWGDPARAAEELLAAGGPRPEARVFLLALADLNGTQRRLLEALPAGHVTSLVFAPASEAEAFDPLGLPRSEAWAEREVPLGSDQWRAARTPDDVARTAVEWLAERDPGSVDQVTLGLLARDLEPHLERHFARAGVELRSAGGTPLAASLPFRLLRTVRDWLDGRRSADLAALVRHPDLERVLERRAAGLDAPSLLDRFQREHLQARLAEESEAIPGPDLPRRVVELVDRLLGGLTSARKRPLADWTAAVRELLTAVYEAADSDPADEQAWRQAAALEAFGQALVELEELPLEGAAGLLREAGARDALDLLLERTGSMRVPAPPRDDALELLGWLELAVDDAPHLVLAGFNEGALPEPVRSDAFLPERLRVHLGLPDERRRLARDVWALTAVLASRPGVLAICQQQSRDGDPLRPSRLLFHAPAAQCPERVRRFFGSTHRRQLASTDPPAGELPRRAASPPELYSVTGLKAYLESPYQYYLRYVLGLGTVDADARELDPLQFGNLAHLVLQRFGSGELRHSTDADAIAEFLRGTLDELSAERFGPRVLPAVRLQVEQLRYRLEHLAARQAAHARAGWRIHAVEQEIENFALDVDGRPAPFRGRIDRIDRHASTGAWWIIDYKTGERGDSPGKGFDKGEWRDLQLPIYREMARPLTGVDEVTLGHFLLPRKVDEIALVAVDWDAAFLDEGIEKARDCVRRIRAGEFFELGPRPPWEDVLAAIEGRGILAAAAAAEEAEALSNAAGGEGSR